MQKVITLMLVGDNDHSTIETKELIFLNDFLQEGYKVVSVTTSNAGQGYHAFAVVIIEKADKKQGSISVG